MEDKDLNVCVSQLCGMHGAFYFVVQYESIFGLYNDLNWPADVQISVLSFPNIARTNSSIPAGCTTRVA